MIRAYIDINGNEQSFVGIEGKGTDILDCSIILLQSIARQMDEQIPGVGEKYLNWIQARILLRVHDPEWNRIAGMYREVDVTQEEEDAQ